MRRSEFKIGTLGEVAYYPDTDEWVVEGGKEGHLSPALSWALLECVRRAGIEVTEVPDAAE
jgi:hypothetical protein